MHKRFGYALIVIGLIGLISQQAFSIAPLQLVTEAKNFVFGFFEVPHNQAVQTQGYRIKLDTGHQNRLINSNFDSEVATEGWEEAGVLGFTQTVSKCLDDKCLELLTTDILAAGELRQSVNFNTHQLNAPLELSIWIYRGSTDEGAYEVCLDTECARISHSGGYREYVIAGITKASNKVYVRPIDNTFVNGTQVDIAVDVASLSVKNSFQQLQYSSDWEDMGVVSIEATGTNPTKSSNIAIDKCWARRRGDSADIRIEYRQLNSAGSSSGSGDYLFSPCGLKIDTNKVTPYTNVEGSGTWLSNNSVGTNSSWSTGNNLTGPVVVYNEDSVRFFTANASAEGVIGSSWNSISNGNIVYIAEFTVPIQGWTTGIIPTTIQREELCQVTASGNDGESISANSEDIPFKNVVKDKCSLWSNDGNTGNDTNDAYTARIDGMITVSLNNQAGTGGTSYRVYEDGVELQVCGTNISGTTLKSGGCNIKTQKGSVYTFRFSSGQTLNNNAITNIINISELPQSVSAKGLFLENNMQDKFSDTEIEYGRWNGEQLYRRCYEVTADITTDNALITTWDASLKPKNALNWTTTFWQIQGVTDAGSSTRVLHIRYNSANGEVRISSNSLSPWKVGAGTSFCMDYTK